MKRESRTPPDPADGAGQMGHQPASCVFHRFFILTLLGSMPDMETTACQRFLLFTRRRLLRVL